MVEERFEGLIGGSSASDGETPWEDSGSRRSGLVGGGRDRDEGEEAVELDRAERSGEFADPDAVRDAQPGVDRDPDDGQWVTSYRESAAFEHEREGPSGRFAPSDVESGSVDKVDRSRGTGRFVSQDRAEIDFGGGDSSKRSSNNDDGFDFDFDFDF